MISRDLSFILKVNGMTNKIDDKEAFIQDVAESYNEAKINVITRFKALVNSNLAIKATINGVKHNLLIDIIEGRKIVSAENGVLKNGDYIEYSNNNGKKEGYLVVSKPEDQEDYQTANLLYCNQVYSLKGVTSEPCILEYKSFGDGIEFHDNDLLPDYTSMASMIVQKNDKSNLIKRNNRFVFNNSKNEIYEVSDMDGVTYEGLYVITLKKVDYMKEDDLENNIGFDYNSNNQSNKNYIINGDNKLKVGNSAIYTISPMDNVVFSINDLATAEIVSQNGNSCTILGKGNQIKNITLMAKKNEVLVAIFYIKVYV